MSSFVNVMFFLIPPAAISAALYVAFRAVKKGVKPTRAARRHVLALVMTTVALLALTVAVSAASDAATTGDTAATTAAQSDGGSSKGLGLLSAGLSTGLAGIGGGIALAGGIPAAIGATSEDPKNFSKALIFVALGETIALYGIVISVMILSRL